MGNPDVKCAECRLWYRTEFDDGRLSDAYGRCGLKMPPWVKDASWNGQHTTATWDGCSFGQRAALAAAPAEE